MQTVIEQTKLSLARWGYAHPEAGKISDLEAELQGWKITHRGEIHDTVKPILGKEKASRRLGTGEPKSL